MSQIFSPPTSKRLCSEDGTRLDNRDNESDTGQEAAGLNASNLEGSLLSGVMTRSRWRIKTSSSMASSSLSPSTTTSTSNIKSEDNLAKLCSICLRDLPEFGDATLVTPCLCVGDKSHQHRSCIEDWLEQTGANSCPNCNVRYEFIRSKRGFLAYVRESELQHDMLINLAAFFYALYLFLVGLSVCHDYLFPVVNSMGGCSSQQTLERASNLQALNAVRRWSSWAELELVLECRNSLKAFDELHSWPSLTLFCLTCVGTILLLIGLVSLGLNMTFRHYIKYSLWAKTNSKVTIKPYRLACISRQQAVDAAST